jgi:flagellar biosynthesis protein
MSNNNNRRQEINEPKGAAALLYDPGEMAAPRIVAKGKGHMAKKILSEAKKYGIPIREDKFLFRILCELELGTEIPLEIYEPVARILAFVYSVHHRSKKETTNPSQTVDGTAI